MMRPIGFEQPVIAGAVTTFNPAAKAATVTLSGGNLTAAMNAGGPGSVRSTTSKASGKWHVEFTSGTVLHPGYPDICLADATFSLTVVPGLDTHAIEYQPDGNIYFNSAIVAVHTAWATGDIIAMEVDVGAGLVYFQVFGHARSAGITIGVAGALFVAFGGNFVGDTYTANFGASAFTIAPTAGFSAWG